MNATNAGHALGVVVVDELIRCGLTHAVVSPGSRSTPLALALAERPEVNLKVIIDERSAAFTALGIAKQSERPVAILTTSGSAVANLFPAVVEAHHSNVPLVLLTADRPPELRDTGAGQTIDQIKVFGNFVRWFAEVGVAEAKKHSVAYWRSIACRAFFGSLHGPPGPVHLNLAFRDPLTPRRDEHGFDFDLSGRVGGEPWARTTRARLELPDATVEELGSEISGTERGLILAGPSSALSEEVAMLAEQSGYPVLAEATSNVRNGPHAVSTYEALLRHPPFAESHRPDLVLRIGVVGLSSTLAAFLDPGIRQVHIDPYGAWRDPGRAASWFLQTDPGLLCRSLSAAVALRRKSDWLEFWTAAEGRAREAMDSYLDSLHEITEPGVARDLAAALPAGWNLVAASSMPVRDLDWFMSSRPDLRVFANRGANGIDGFVSTTMGIALASGGRTAALCGDLSLLHDQNGFLPASGDQPEATFVVINNDGGGIFSFLPQAGESNFEQLFGTPHGLDLSKLSAGYGIGFQRLDSPQDLSSALDRARTAGGVQMIEARTDRSRNVEIHRTVWAEVAKAIGS